MRSIELGLTVRWPYATLITVIEPRSAQQDDAYPTLVEKAAALMHSIARNHALDDGNKRLAWSATRIFLLLNDADLAYEIDEAEQMVVAVAAGRLDVPALEVNLGRWFIGSSPAATSVDSQGATCDRPS